MQGKLAWTEEEIVVALREATKRLGRVPTLREAEKDPALPAGKTLRRHFGTYNEALRKAGLPWRMSGGAGRHRAAEMAPAEERMEKEKQTLIAILLRFHRQFGRVPLPADHQNCSYLPGRAAFVRRFGTFNKAVLAAGLEPRESGGQPERPRNSRKSPPNRSSFEGWAYDKGQGNPAPIKERSLKRNAL